MNIRNTLLGARSHVSLKATMTLVMMVCSQFFAWGQTGAGSYPIESVRWDKVPTENREVIEQLFADMVLVPESGEVKKFYISTHEVQSGLWAALMPNENEIVVAGQDSGQISVSGGGRDALKHAPIPYPKSDIGGGRVKVSPSLEDIQTFISLLRKQTGKRFRLPTENERKWAAQFELIDTIADATDSIGKGFYLALDTIAKAGQKMLVITAMDGTTSKYLLEGMPQIKIEKPYLVISSGMASVSMLLENLQHMHYEKATDEATAIGEIKVFDEKGGSERIDFSNLPADARVSIYTLDGKQLYSMRPGQGKNISLPLGSLQSGIYLVKVNDVTYKIQKP